MHTREKFRIFIKFHRPTKLATIWAVQIWIKKKRNKADFEASKERYLRN